MWHENSSQKQAADESQSKVSHIIFSPHMYSSHTAAKILKFQYQAAYSKKPPFLHPIRRYEQFFLNFVRTVRFMVCVISLKENGIGPKGEAIFNRLIFFEFGILHISEF